MIDDHISKVKLTEEDEGGWINYTLFIFLAKKLKHNFNERRPPPMPSWDARKEEHEKYSNWMRSITWRDFTFSVPWKKK